MSLSDTYPGTNIIEALTQARDVARAKLEYERRARFFAYGPWVLFGAEPLPGQTPSLDGVAWICACTDVPMAEEKADALNAVVKDGFDMRERFAEHQLTIIETEIAKYN